MRENIIKICDRTMEWLIYISIFWMPFFKAGLEIGITLIFVCWVAKRIAVFNLGDGYERWHPSLRWLLIFKPVKTPLNLPLTIFIAAAGVSIFQSAYIMRSLDAFFFRLLEWVFVYFAIAETINTKQRLKNLCQAVIFSAIVVIGDAVAQYLRGVDLICGRKLVQGRITSCFGHFNTLAMYLGPVIFIVLRFALMVNGKKRQLSYFTLVVILLVLCMIYTGSRGGWVSLFLAIAVLGCFNDRRMLILMLSIAAIFFMVVRIDKTFINPDGYAKVLRLADSGRFEIWRGGMAMFKDKPIFGFGINTFMYSYPKYMITTPNSVYKSDLPHNCYLMIAVEMGIFGIAAFLFFLYALFKNLLCALRQIPRNNFLSNVLTGLLGALICYLIHSFFDNNLQTMQTAFLFWFMAGMVVACLNIWQKEKETSEISSS